MPPTTSTVPLSVVPLASSVAVWARMADGNAVAAVQVVLPFQSSVVLSELVPLVEPPATKTWPFASTLLASSVAVCSRRAEVIVPALAQLPDPEAALKSWVVFKVAEPLSPPVMSTLPFASAVAVCPSRLLESATPAVHVVPSKS